jgi:protocatechuate 3,4-dioxygenase beta subunit
LAALEKWEDINHNKTDILDYSPNTPESVIFGGNTSAILTPTVTDGPYYVWGEILRQNVKEETYCAGVDLTLEIQYIDVTTCRPVKGAVVDIWNANATGVYRYDSSPIERCATADLTVASLPPATTLPAAGTPPTSVVSSRQMTTAW